MRFREIFFKENRKWIEAEHKTLETAVNEDETIGERRWWGHEAMPSRQSAQVPAADGRPMTLAATNHCTLCDYFVLLLLSRWRLVPYDVHSQRAQSRGRTALSPPGAVVSIGPRYRHVHVRPTNKNIRPRLCTFQRIQLNHWFIQCVQLLVARKWVLKSAYLAKYRT
jgi:hypothetical protein